MSANGRIPPVNTFSAKPKTETQQVRIHRTPRAVESAVGFVDDHPGAIAQRKLHDLMNRSTEVQRLAQLQDQMNKSPRAQALPQAQGEIVNSPRQDGIAASTWLQETKSAGINSAEAPIQRIVRIGLGKKRVSYSTVKNGDELCKALAKYGANWKRGWRTHVKKLVRDWPTNHDFDSLGALAGDVKKIYEKTAKTKIDRPGFVGRAEKLGKVTKSLQDDEDQSGFKPGENNQALPHRYPYSDIKNSTLKFVNGTEDDQDLIRWSDRLREATEQRRDLNMEHDLADEYVHEDYEDEVNEQLEKFDLARQNLIDAKNNDSSMDETAPEVYEFIKQTNSLHGNIPDYGPHVGVNVQVSNRLHAHIQEDGSMSPGTEAAFGMSPERVEHGYATTQDDSLITTDGFYVPFNQWGSFLDQNAQDLINRHFASQTTLQDDDLTEHPNV